MSAHLGIDPGLTGAVALLTGESAQAVRDMPVIADGRVSIVSATLLAELFRELTRTLPERPTVFIERVGSMPKQGVASTFSFGKSAGIVEGVVGALGLPYRLVTPSVWKRRANLIGKPKDASRALAIALYPEMAPRLTRKKDNGRAEALLIARFGSDT